MAGMATQLAGAGMMEDALVAIEETRDRGAIAQAGAGLADALADVESEQALMGIHVLLRFVRIRGRRPTSRTMAGIVPLIVKLGGPKRGTDLVWRTYERIMEMESWWQH